MNAVDVINCLTFQIETTHPCQENISCTSSYLTLVLDPLTFRNAQDWRRLKSGYLPESIISHLVLNFSLLNSMTIICSPTQEATRKLLLYNFVFFTSCYPLVKRSWVLCNRGLPAQAGRGILEKRGRVTQTNCV